MNQYKHITKTERLEISILLQKGYSLTQIAKALQRSKSTISEEVAKRLTKGSYDPQRAHLKASVKRSNSKYQGMKIIKNKGLRQFIENKLNDDWSPEQISGRIEYIESSIKKISYKSVYKYIHSSYGGVFERRLRYSKRGKGKRKYTKDKVQDRTFIEEREEIVNNRGRFGDWEGDFIVSGKSGQGVLLVLHERRSRYPLIRKINSRKTEVINKEIKKMIGGFVAFNSLTLDNDLSFSKHKELSENIGAPIFFCHPYHSWEKGAVENTNGLIRQYIPKGDNISKYSKEFVGEIERKLQTRPRKCLGFKSPLEVMRENNQFKKDGLFQDNPSIKKQAGCSA